MEKPGKEDILEARERIQPFIHRTPIFTSKAVNEVAGCRLFLKCENFQKTGSFKIRGATNTILSLAEKKGDKIFATHSSGNHAQAVAFAARLANSIAHIVMPKTAPEVKKKGVKNYGGLITFCEPTEADRLSTCDKIISETGATMVHPFEDPRIIAGQASVASEIFEELKPDFILSPVGGGGLSAGTALATRFFSQKTRFVIGEPKEADDTYRSFQEGNVVPVVNPKTIADGLKTTVGKLNFDIIKEGAEEVITVTEEEIIEAMRLIWERMKIIIEPSSAVPVASVLKQKSKFANKDVAVIITGGNVDLKGLPF